MPGRKEQSAAFLRLVANAVDRGLLLRRDLQELSNAPKPLNPMSLASGSELAEQRFALTEAFKGLLLPRVPLDWDGVRTGASDLVAQLTRQQECRRQAGRDTRWMTLAPTNPFFDFSRWAASWSRRDLESVLEFFSEDARYTDVVRGYNAQGKSELRSLLAQLFHAFDGAVAIDAAWFDPIEAECELEWVQTALKIPGSDKGVNLGGGKLRGTSNLWLKAGKIIHCVDAPNSEDLKQIALGSLSTSSITESDTLVTAVDVVLMKPVKLRRKGAKPDEGKDR